MFIKKYVFWGVLLLLAGVCGGFENHYAEVASSLRSNIQAIDDVVLLCPSDSSDVDLEKNNRPFRIYGNVNYAHNRGQYFHSNDGIALIGGDFIWQHFFLKRSCTLGVFTGVAKDFMSYDDRMLLDGNLKYWFAGYYLQSHFWGLDFSDVLSFGFGQSNTDTKAITIAGKNFDHFTHNHRYIHTAINVSRTWSISSWEVSPCIGLHTEKLKQNGAKEWQQDALRLSNIAGIGGLKIEKNHSEYRIDLFLGGEYTLRNRWSGGEIFINNVPKSFSLTSENKAKLLITTGICYYCTPSYCLNFTFSGRYGGHEKNSTLGISLNKTF